MGLFSWVRRVREADGPRTVSGPGDRPLRGLLGGPSRQAPEQRAGAPDPAIPSPLTTERLRSWFSRHGYSYFVDDDGDVGGLWRGRLFHFFLFGEHQEILQVRGQWNREFAIERLTDVLEICNEWNAEKIWPKAYVRVRDDGMVHVTCEVATDLEHGVSDAQLGQLLQCGLSAASVFFDTLDQLYPDPASAAP
ncbi:YbjN domain-containing protein [Cellulomonas sp. KRMCY2]|uniref:YbjN domain-containing protein n=1 Tax=Cellulomonas sp. KRMCY2 TaxID=1304865 RepID=UPI00045EA3B1|nr:YbjN domain-containing protein [Cellulomonas sp. KRMCY2]